MRRCLIIYDKECEGEGPLPYLVIDEPQGEGRSAGRQALDAWVQKRWQPARSLETYGYKVDIFTLDREEIKALTQTP